jgi:hypothetical protein
MALWSERQGHRRGLNHVDLRDALFEVLQQLDERGLFSEAFGEKLHGSRIGGGEIDDPERWVRNHLKDASLWQYLDRPWTVTADWDPEYSDYPRPKKWQFPVLFDIIELLHGEAVSAWGVESEKYDQEAGRQEFRDAVNPVLAQLEPPKVLSEDGEIVDAAELGKAPIADAIVQREAPGGGSQPALSDEVYGHVVEVIRRVGRGMELSPTTYHRLDEEARRDIYVVTLNTHYEDQTSGEAFNFTGKTDILVRYEGENVFLGECKIWDGPQSLVKALDQVLGYASWRDTKLALIMFVPNAKFSDVIDKARETIEEQEQFVRWANPPTQDQPMRAVVRWHGDEDQHADLAVFLVHLPQ